MPTRPQKEVDSKGIISKFQSRGRELKGAPDTIDGVTSGLLWFRSPCKSSLQLSQALRQSRIAAQSSCRNATLYSLHRVGRGVQVTDRIRLLLQIPKPVGCERSRQQGSKRLNAKTPPRCKASQVLQTWRVTPLSFLTLEFSWRDVLGRF